MKLRNGLKPVLDVVLAARRRRSSMRNKGYPAQSTGAASPVRRLAGDDLESRARELGAVVSPRRMSQRAGADKSGTHKALAVPKLSHDANLGQPSPAGRSQQWSSYARWQHLRLRGQARFFDMDRPEAIR